MPDLSLVLVIAFTVITVWTAWSSYRSSQSAVKQLFNLAVTFLVNAFLGVVTPWYASVPIMWWYLLVAATAAYAATTTFSLTRRRETPNP
ncbi:hypothetical protein CPHO_00775 [Corynebacterium phocae]|uniref:Holin n=1 Tax=Corynebacterium phocae TaxID=161895 RepID=A0A1L7D165_9CORY|nr:hypothetical protein CPHO_00775 [Corynebacterium phocae]